jgi:flagellar biosynthesis/type III secretory pathway protein FliH
LKQSGRNAETGDTQTVEVYEYPSGALPGEGARAHAAKTHASVLFPTGSSGKPSDQARHETLDSVRADFDRRLTEETRRAFEAGREQGRLEGRQSEREAQAGAVVAAERERLRKAAELVERFAGERDRYFAEVEREVVELALGIAARILRREAQMDPLLLTGAVRVALGQLSASTAAQLVVPSAELDLWQEAIAHTPNLAVKPVVVAGEGMRLGECVIKSDLGSVDLGLRNQLGEIERGFFDRVGSARKAPSPPNSTQREAGA